MREEIIISGRMNEGVDPVLHLWHWPIPTYLFLGGLAAGLLFFASLYYLLNKDTKYTMTVKIAPIIAPIAIILGLIALIYDLKHQLYFWQLLTTVRLESPMSWGAWTLTLIMPVSIIWIMTFLKEILPNPKWKLGIANKMQSWIIDYDENAKTDLKWEWKFGWIKSLEVFFSKERKAIAWIQIILAIILGVYTGILLSAFNSRPLWNTSLLGPLFLVSGLSTGAAAIMWMSNDQEERKLFSKIDIMLIIIELFFITHLFMGFMASTEVQIESARLFLGGEFTVPFWGFVVVLGLLVPLALEVMELRGIHVPIAVPAFLILVGGLIFRFVMVEAGQITRYLY